MPRSTPRYVIKHPKGYYTHHEIVKTVPVKLNNVLIGHENISEPAFKGMVQSHGAQFNSAADAQLMIDDKDNQYGGAAAFAGCVVEENTEE